jgi:hypothetical protein
MPGPRMVLVLLMGALGCGTTGSAGPADVDAAPDAPAAPDAAMPGPLGPPFDYVAGLPQGEAARAHLCGLPRDDRFRRWYCAGASAPTIEGIASLLAGVQLGEDGFPELGCGDNFAVVAHSTALLPLDATPLNPRVVFSSKPDEAELAAAIYTRGELVAELAMKDLVHNQLDFYLVMFHLPCGRACTEADLHLDPADAGWKDVSVFAEEDLKNTPLDCLRCHVPSGGTGQRILRMHEIRNPWTHWFWPNSEVSVYGSNVLSSPIVDSRPAGATYASVPVSRLVHEGGPQVLESFLERNGFGDQPNHYEGRDINNDDPLVSVASPAWLSMYAAAEQGTTIDAPPHFVIEPFDPNLIESVRLAYLAVASGHASASTLPSVTRGLWDDDALRYIGYKPGKGLDASGMVRHVCGPCHDGRFPGQSRDNFRVADFPDGLSAEMKAKVLARVALGREDPLLMPPVIAGELDAAEIQQIQAALAP